MGTRRSSAALARVLACLLAFAVAASALETAHEPSHRMLTKRRHHKPAPHGNPGKASSKAKPSHGGGLPAALQELYDNLDSHSCYKGVKLDKNPRPYTDGGNTNNAHYCGNKAKNPDAVWWVANGDVDCDGTGGQTGKCSHDPTHQDQTAMLAHGKYLNAQRVPFAVMNIDKYFNPADFGIRPMAAVALVCHGQLFWSVYGDTNPLYQIGEGSLDLIEKCNPGASANNASNDAYLWVAFPGSDAVDPNGGSNLGSLTALGDKLANDFSL